jgi:hypothetical protein
MTATMSRFRSWINRLWNRLFPIHTHCSGCGEELDEPSRQGCLCWQCLVW